jgi:hypothetical protein
MNEKVKRAVAQSKPWRREVLVLFKRNVWHADKGANEAKVDFCW